MKQVLAVSIASFSPRCQEPGTYSFAAQSDMSRDTGAQPLYVMPPATPFAR